MTRPTCLTRRHVVASAFLTLFFAPGIGVNPAASQDTGDGLVFRRIWVSSTEHPGPGRGAPAQGRFFATFVGNAEDVAIYDLERDRVETLTDEWARGDSADMAMSPLISPDASRVVYLLAHFFDRESGENQLRVVRRDGGGDRILVAEPMPFWIEPLAWMPDGRSVIAQQRPSGMIVDEELELVVVSLQDGSRRVIRRFDVRALRRFFVSPDGRYAALDLPQDDAGNDDIHAVDLASGATWPLVRGNGDDQLMGWDPDGSGVFFYSNRELGRAIWRLPVRDGRATGDPELVRNDVWDLVPSGFSGDQYFYQVLRAAPQIRTATLDFGAGRVETPPTMIRSPSDGWSRDPAWSPDGRHLAFLDYPSGDDWATARARLGIRSVHTGETRYLSFPFLSGARMHWVDAGSILVIGRHGDEGGIHRLDLQSGEVTLLREGPAQGPESSLSLSPDGTTYYFHRNRSEIWAGDVATGRETLLARVEGAWRRIGVSPDGSMLVVRAGGIGFDEDQETRLVVIPSAGGEPREIYRGDVLRRGSSFLEITPDNKYVIAASFALPPGIWRFSIDGASEPVKIHEGEAPRSFRMSPDGRRIAYWEFADPEGRVELWVIEGLVGVGRR